MHDCTDAGQRSSCGRQRDELLLLQGVGVEEHDTAAARAHSEESALMGTAEVVLQGKQGGAVRHARVARKR